KWHISDRACITVVGRNIAATGVALAPAMPRHHQAQPETEQQKCVQGEIRWGLRAAANGDREGAEEAAEQGEGQGSARDGAFVARRAPGGGAGQSQHGGDNTLGGPGPAVLPARKQNASMA